MLLLTQPPPLCLSEIQQEELNDVKVHLLALVFSQNIAFMERHKGEQKPVTEKTEKLLRVVLQQFQCSPKD